MRSETGGTYCQSNKQHQQLAATAAWLSMRSLVCLTRSLFVNPGGENSFFRIVRGINNMKFEEECVFALFDATELQAVLSGKRRGGMFGIVDEKRPAVTEVRYNDTQTTNRQSQDKSNKVKERNSRTKLKLT